MELKKVFRSVKHFAAEFSREKPLQLAASLAFYTLLSLAPLVLVVVGLAGLVFGRNAVEGQVVLEMKGLVGEPGAEVIQTVIRNVHMPGQGLISLVLGLATLLVGATTVFVQLQSALNQIWEVKADPKRKGGLLAMVRDRLLSLAMILGVGFLLLVSLLMSAGLSAASSWTAGHLSVHPVVWQGLDMVVSFAVITLLIAMIFKFLPDAEITWKNVAFGAVITALLFTVGKHLIGLYLGRASLGSAYGAAGSVVVLMVWVYYAGLIFFLGAKLTQMRTRHESGQPKPVQYAVESALKPGT